MNRDIDDPNNHVPEVSPNDNWADIKEWDDLDAEASKARSNSKNPIPSGKIPKGDQQNESGAQADSSISGKSVVSKITPGLTKRGYVTGTGRKKARFEKQQSISLHTFEPADAGYTPGPQATSDSEPSTAWRSSELAGKPVGTGKPIRKLHSSSKREPNQWGRSDSRRPMAWILYSGIGVICLTSFAVFLNQNLVKNSTQGSGKSIFSSLEPVEKNTDEESELDPELRPSLEFSGKRQQAMEMYAEFVNADSVDELMPLIFQSARNEPLLRESWSESGSDKEWIPSDSSRWQLLESPDEFYAILRGVAHDFSEFSAYFRLDDEKNLKLDWRATTGFGTATFEELRQGQGNPEEIRAVIGSSDYYNYSFPEESYQSYKLLSPDGQSTIWVYAERGSPVDEEISGMLRPSQIMGRSKGELQMTVSLSRGPESSMKNQWLIVQVLEPNWLEDDE